MDHSSPIRVLAAVLDDGAGRLLLCRRPDHKRHGGLWEFPGGKIEPGESPVDAARRELKEELRLSVDGVAELLYAAHDPGSRFVIEFYRVAATGSPDPTEHSEVAWVRSDELLSLPLAPSDESFARFLTKLEAAKRLLLLVTLEKEGMQEDHRYQDSFVSREVFKWQSQNRNKPEGKIGRILSGHAALGYEVHLFVRRTRTHDEKAAAFLYCGMLNFVKWEGTQPIDVWWRLEPPLSDSVARRLGVS